MAKLSSFKINSKAREAGEWRNPGPEYDGLELLVRGFTDQYHDARALRMAKASRGFGGDVSKIPSSISRSITVACIDDFVLLDVKGLNGDDDQPVTRDQFADLLRNPDFGELLTATITAASQVGQARAEDVGDVAGNSGTPSA